MGTNHKVVILEFNLSFHSSFNGKILVPGELSFNRNGFPDINDFLFSRGRSGFQPCFHRFSLHKYTHWQLLLSVHLSFLFFLWFSAFPHKVLPKAVTDRHS